MRLRNKKKIFKIVYCSFINNNVEMSSFVRLVCLDSCLRTSQINIQLNIVDCKRGH